MSIKALNLAWATPIKPTGLKLVLLHFADRADDNGGSLYPSMADTARRCDISRAQAQRHVKALVTAGLLSVVANAKGGPPGATTRYRLQIERLGQPAPGTGSTGATGSVDAADGYHPCGEGVAPMRQTGITGDTLTTTNHHEHGGRVVEGACAPPPPGAGSAPHPWIDSDAWRALGEHRPDLNMSEVLKAAEYYHGQGVGETAMTAALQSLRFNKHHKALSPTRVRPAPSPSTAKPKRATARKTALVIDPGRDTRAPGRNYEQGTAK